MRAEDRSRRRSFLPISAMWLSRVASVSAMLGAMSLMACNSVTGAGDLRLKDPDEFDEDDGDDTDSNNNPSGGSTNPTTGGGATACKYPAGTYGNQLNDVVSPELTWQGFAEGSKAETELSDIKISDYYDCDGKQGTNAVLILQSATWCGYCDEEAQQLNARMEESWKAMGIRVLTLMIEDATSNPATTKTAYEWKSTPSHDLVSTAVVADPSFSFAPDVPPGESIGLPVILVLDPRTMQITAVQQGSSGSYPELEALAKKNAAATK